MWVPTIVKYDAEQPRNEKGEFASSGVTGSSGEKIPAYATLMSMKTVPGPKGSQGGVWKQSEGGTKYFVKPLKDAIHGFNEVAAGCVYHVAGIKFPNTGVVKDSASGKYYLVSQKIEGLTQKSAEEWKSNKDLQARAAQGFGVDALMSHWDVHGLTGDNTLIDKNGDPVRIESGGAMAFRATGGEKGINFSPTGEWTEPSSMRTSAQGKAMYGSMTTEQAGASLAAAGKIDLKVVQERWDEAGIPRNVSHNWMQTLQSRQEKIPNLATVKAAMKAGKA